MTGLEWDDRIFSNIVFSVKNICQNVVRQADNVPAVFPTLLVQQIQGADYKPDLEITDCGSTVTYEIQAYCKGTNKISEAKEIIQTTYDAFHEMGFYCVQNTQVRTIASLSSYGQSTDASIFRLVSRFRRFIGSGEEIIKLE